MKLWKIFGRAHDEPEGRVAAGISRDLAGRTEKDRDLMVHDEESTPTDASEVPRGKLASFCPACPQPGINLPEDWVDDEQRYPFPEILTIKAYCLF